MNNDETKKNSESTIINMDGITTEYNHIETPNNDKNDTKSNPLTTIIHKDSTGLILRWNDVRLSATVKDNETKSVKTKHILKGISGEALPGELLVVMGPSGAGKSSFLDCIAGRNDSFTGTVTVNGQPFSKSINKLCAYVLQDDLFYETLTVREHLLFQAELRTGGILSRKEREELVESTMEELGLTKTAQTLIGGSKIRGISGGERKRLSFATELLTNPSIFYVDEPTSGLDSYMAENIVIQLQQLARNKNRTVITTIHQPSSELYILFDKLVLLSDGSLIYHDKASSAVDYFSSLGYPCPSYMNPTDYFIKQISLKYGDPVSEKKIQNLMNSWNEYKQKNLNDNNTINEMKEKNTIDTLSSNVATLPILSQMKVLCHRNVVRILRDTVSFKARVGQTIFLILLIGLVFLQLDNDQPGVQNHNGAMFFLMVNSIFANASPEFFAIPDELLLFRREYNSSLYYTITWYFAKTVSEFPLQVLFPLILITPVFFMIGFNIQGNGAYTFFIFALIMVLMSSCATGLGYLVGCATAKVQTAAIVGPITILPFLLFGGLLLNTKDTPDYFIWIEYLSPIKYGFQAIMVTFWRRVNNISCEIDSDGTISSCIKNGHVVLERYSMSDIKVWLNCVIIAVINVGFRILAFITLWLNVRQKKKKNKNATNI